MCDQPSRHLQSGSWQAPAHTIKQLQHCKCKEKAVVVVRQREALCWECLEQGVLARVRSAKAWGALEEDDQVLLAVSGGPASLTALYAMNLIKAPGKRAEKGKTPFHLSVVHIEETAEMTQMVKEAVGRAGYQGEIQIVRIEEVFTSESCESSSCQATPSEHLSSLLAAVSDETGREDLLIYLRRMRLMQLANGERGGTRYNKIVTGETCSALAIKVISEAAKGRGFALPGSLQALDSRHGPSAASFLQIMKEVTMKEAALMCRLHSIPFSSSPFPSDSSDKAKLTINSISASFIEGLQANLPSTITTVLRTALNLEPFPFNALPEQDKSQVHRPKARGGERTILCCLCSSPFVAAKSERLGGDEIEGGAEMISIERGSGIKGALAASSCASCKNHILLPIARHCFMANPGRREGGQDIRRVIRWVEIDEELAERIATLLPPVVTQSLRGDKEE